MSDKSFLRIEFLVLFVETLLFGVFCVLYPISIWILVYRQRRNRRRSTPSFWMTAVVTTMFLLAGTYLSIDVNHLSAAFADHSMTPGGPLAYFERPGNDPSRYVSSTIFALMTVLGDAFMMYRIYVVWEQKWFSLIIPGLLLAGDLITTSLVADLLLGGTPLTYDLSFILVGRARFIAYFVVVLLTNIIMTLLLLGRLWWDDRRIRRHCPRDASNSVHWRVMKTIVQSQSVYSIGVVFNLAAYAAHSNLVLITNAILPQLIGISFTLIITRIGLSEVLNVTSDNRQTDATTIEFSDRGRTPPPPIAVDVFVSQSTCSDEIASHDDKARAGEPHVDFTADRHMPVLQKV
ncbi:uncharacterized protein TRAVEDRAFT_75099 [Trametes versicolor FP-101664 SS1]|uniref:uncharacterized protein n=1 Tax=Trametes versicolor (strain FP-101664) TaxID=717944 RepID=UPI0004623CBB|nr:uncharacterized protein TRAVEDRAFT_75099 [Trametes versicolor FP-101664 SS1]EIW52818.1 hypothetical protein TRAVEDRAFT_75099 [Trametes versicolor FP-101664 SS1]